MSASDHIGRVGALAVALGIGAAVATGQGVAWASPTESDPETTNEPTPSAETDGNNDSAYDAGITRREHDDSVHHAREDQGEPDPVPDGADLASK